MWRDCTRGCRCVQNRSDVASRDTCVGGLIAYSIAVDSPLTVAFRLASLSLWDCRWCSAQSGQRVWPRMVGPLQFQHWPSSLGFCRCSWARRRLYSLRSGVLFLTFSYSRRFWRVPLVSAKGVSWGGLSPLSWRTRLFGFGEPLVPAFGSFWVFGSAFLPGPAALEGFLLRWALPGGGKENSKVRPSTRSGGLWVRGWYQMFTLAVIAAVLRGCPCFELGPSFWPRSFSDIRCAGRHSDHIWSGRDVAGHGIPGTWLARPPGCSLLGPWPAPFPWLP